MFFFCYQIYLDIVGIRKIISSYKSILEDFKSQEICIGNVFDIVNRNFHFLMSFNENNTKSISNIYSKLISIEEKINSEKVIQNLDSIKLMIEDIINRMGESKPKVQTDQMESLKKVFKAPEKSVKKNERS